MTLAASPGVYGALLVAGAVVVAPARPRAERPFGSVPEPPGERMQIAYALELLALALAGGAPVATALSAVADSSSDEQVSAVLSRVAAGLKWGLDDAQAWVSAPVPWRPAATAFALAGRAGAAPAELLRRAAQDVRATENERIATAGARVGVRIVVPLGLCFLPAFFLLTVIPLVLGLVDLG